MEFNHICSSFKLIGVSDIELKTVFRVLAGIVHLGYAGVSKSKMEVFFHRRIITYDVNDLVVAGCDSVWYVYVHILPNVEKDETTRSVFSSLPEIIVGSNSGKYQFSQPAAAQRAAKCLGTTVEELSHLIFTPIVPTTTNHGRASISHPSPTDCGKSQANDHSSGVDALEGFIVGLYVELFNLVGSYVNRSISSLFVRLCSSTASCRVLIRCEIIVLDVYRPTRKPLTRFWCWIVRVFKIPRLAASCKMARRSAISATITSKNASNSYFTRQTSTILANVTLRYFLRIYSRALFVTVWCEKNDASIVS